MACQGFIWLWPKELLHLVHCTLSLVCRNTFLEEMEDFFYDELGRYSFRTYTEGLIIKSIPLIGRLLIHPKSTH